jgi:hypothetical protein
MDVAMLAPTIPNQGIKMMLAIRFTINPAVAALALISGFPMAAK